MPLARRTRTRASVGLSVTLLLLLPACAAIGGLIDDLTTDRPPAAALDQATIASDARLDSTGRIAGSFVGEGTRREVHLLSSDSGLIAGLARRYRPVRDRRGDIWTWLADRRVTITLDPKVDSTLLLQTLLVGSPDGHTPVRLERIVLQGASCGWRGAQAEFIVDQARGNGPSLRGPVVGSFRGPGDDLFTDRRFRDALPPPEQDLTDSLLMWTSRAMDSLLTPRLIARDLPLAPPTGRRLELNGLNDDDAADVLPFRLDDGRIRYAVSLRERRRTASGADAVAAIVMVWDATGVWRQVVFRPTLLDLRRGRLVGARSQRTLPLFWRRLEPVSGFAFGRDYLWMEQVNVEDDSVLWVILEPRGNTVVAAAFVEGPC